MGPWPPPFSSLLDLTVQMKMIINFSNGAAPAALSESMRSAKPPAARRSARLRGLGFALGLLLVAPPTTGAAGTEERIRLLEKQLQMMQGELQALREEAAREKAAAQRAREEQETKTDVIAETVDSIKSTMTIPEEMEFQGQYGFAPGASKVYRRDRGLSVGGYGEIVYRKPTTNRVRTAGGVTVDQTRSDAQRLILYTGYKFNDWIVFNSEIEFEHGTTDPTVTQGSGGSVSVELAYLDLFLADWANFRGGVVLAPMGIINEIHEPIGFFGVDRPLVDRTIIPTTWREIGVGLFGDPLPGLSYRVYAFNGLNAAGFSPAGFRGGRQKASKSLANDWAFVGRVDYEPIPDLIVGTSVYTGNSGQGQNFEGDSGAQVRLPSALTTIWEAHGQWRWQGIEARAMLAASWLSDAGDLTLALRDVGKLDSDETIANQMLGMYAEIGYDILPWIFPDTGQQLLPFFRYEYNNTQLHVPSGPTFLADGAFQDRIWTIGLNYRPIPQVVLKADYRDWSPVTGTKANTVDLGLGFVF